MEWLTTLDIDVAVDALSADDLIEAQAAAGSAGNGSSVLMVKVAFNRAAERAGLGPDATTRVRASDFKYLAEKAAGVINADGPLPEGTEVLLASAATGE